MPDEFKGMADDLEARLTSIFAEFADRIDDSTVSKHYHMRRTKRRARNAGVKR